MHLNKEKLASQVFEICILPFFKERNGTTVTVKDLAIELARFKKLMGIESLPMGKIYRLAKSSASKSDIHHKAFDLLKEMIRSRYIQKVRVYMLREGTGTQTLNVSSPQAVYSLEFLQEELQRCDREKFVCLHLDTKNNLVSCELIAMGSSSSTVVHPREVFKGAILANAASVILCHNHPSGDCEPSVEDIRLTKRLAEAGKILGIEVLDHVIFGNASFVTLKERGLV